MPNLRLTKLLEMEQEDPQDLFIQYALAMEYLGDNQPVLAQKQFERCLQMASEHIPAYYQLAVLLHNQGKSEEALERIEAGLLLLKGSTDTRTINEFRSLRDEIMY